MLNHLQWCMRSCELPVPLRIARSKTQWDSKVTTPSKKEWIMRRLVATVVAAGLLGPGAAAVAQPTAAPSPGQSVWIQSNGRSWQMLRIWRSGSKVRIYHDDGAYPGDGKDCAWGSLKAGTFKGKIQRLAPEPSPIRLTIKRDGKRLRVTGLQDAGPIWKKSSLSAYAAKVPRAGSNPGAWCRTFRPL